LIKFWVNSPYTNPYLKDSIKNFDYFIDNRIIPVSWWGPFTDAGGYANMNREIVFRLHNHYILPKIDICPTAPQISATARYYISKYSSFDLSKFKRHLKIWSFTPIPHPPNPGKNVFFTMMETESLHPEFARICNVYADEIWVPSTHNATVFKEYGIKKPIFVMPLGVDELLYYNRDIAPNGIINDTKCFVDLLGKPVSKGINSFRFLSLFGWSYRKGTDILIKSFVKEFNDNDDVALIIVSRHSGSPEQSHINVIKADVDRYAKSIRRSNFPQIILHPHVIPEQQMPDIYKMGQVFLHCSRGEGWNLPVIEAAACGLPVISCNNTGMSEYLTDDNAFLIKTNQKEICNPEMHWITAYYHNQLFPKLGSEQIEQSQNHMKFCRNNYEKALLKGKELKKLVFEKYTWKHAVERIAQRIHQII
jgi:glycosyltransferase involved in cell wall biosynthesis